MRRNVKSVVLGKGNVNEIGGGREGRHLFRKWRGEVNSNLNGMNNGEDEESGDSGREGRERRKMWGGNE
jgi:hypothetical protein